MIKKTKLTKIGGSNYLFVPHEFVEVFNLDKFSYEVSIDEDSETIIYKRKELLVDKEQTKLDDFGK